MDVKPGDSVEKKNSANTEENSTKIFKSLTHSNISDSRVPFYGSYQKHLSLSGKKVVDLTTRLKDQSHVSFPLFGYFDG